LRVIFPFRVMRKTTVFLLALLLLGSVAGAQQTPVALIGARVLPVSGPPLDGATVLIVDGKIAAVGANVAVPANAQRIDLHGSVLIPGLVDARSSLFLSSDDLVGAGTADQDVLDAANLFDRDAEKVLAHGVTTLYLSPGSRGNIDGIGAVVKLDSAQHTATQGGLALQARPLKPHAALNLTLGVSGNGRSSSLERLNSYEALRATFRSAEQYARAFERYERDLLAYEKQEKLKPPEKKPDLVTKEAKSAPPKTPPAAPPAAKPAEPALTKPVKPRHVPAMDNLMAALKGDLPVRIEAHRVDDILNALRLADEFKLKLILERATEGADVAQEIARRKVPVVWGPTMATGGPRLETAHHTPESAALLAQVGVKIALTTGGESGLASRFLLENAAAAGGFGLRPTDALRAITLSAAEVLGVADRVGSIQAGKDADLVVLSALPWEPTARVKTVFVNGVIVYRAQ
jgi:imidazolonepropionase-like amidohydrolase